MVDTKNLKVGDVFASIAHTIGFTPSDNCSCCSTQESMNAHGPKLCRSMPGPFVQSIKNELKARNLDLIPDAVIRQAIYTACYITENPDSLIARLLIGASLPEKPGKKNF